MIRAEKEEAEAIAELNLIANGGDESLDVEGGHMRADEILCEFITSAGYPDLAEAFRNASRVRGFWYS